MMKMTHGKIIAFASVIAAGLMTFSWHVMNSWLGDPVVHAQALPDKKAFMVFDGTLYADKPDLSVHGIRPVSIAYTGQFGVHWYKNSDILPEKIVVQKIAQEAQEKNAPVVIDIEHWPLVGDPNEVRASLSKYMTVLQWFKEAAPGLPVGYYGAPPIRDYWKSLKSPMSKEWASFARENDQLRPLAGAVDIIFPSLYTFYTDRGAWVRYAYAQIAEARRSALRWRSPPKASSHGGASSTSVGPSPIVHRCRLGAREHVLCEDLDPEPVPSSTWPVVGEAPAGPGRAAVEHAPAAPAWSPGPHPGHGLGPRRAPLRGCRSRRRPARFAAPW